MPIIVLEKYWVATDIFFCLPLYTGIEHMVKRVNAKSMTDQVKHGSSLADSEQDQLSRSQKEKETGTAPTLQICKQIAGALTGV